MSLKRAAEGRGACRFFALPGIDAFQFVVPLRYGSSVERVAARVLVALVLLLSCAGDVHAQSVSDVAIRVSKEWGSAGGQVTVMPPRFLFDGESVRVATGDYSGSGCTHIALVGTRSLAFRARFADASNDPFAGESSERVASVSGIAELRRCGRAPDPIVVTTGSSRGVLEIVVARAPSALPALVAVLPERTGGWVPPVPDVGGLAVLPPPGKRAETAEARARREGARISPRTLVEAGDDGAGEFELELAPGCHRVELFARDPAIERAGRHVAIDVDAELRDVVHHERVLARDRAETPDARLEACVGETSQVAVLFAGAPPKSQLVSTLGSWSLPAHLPLLWGPVVRSRMARIMFTRHIASPTDAPIYLGQGGAGTSPFPLSVEVGGCYVAVVALTHGTLRTLQVRTILGARESTDERGAAEEAALSAFCVAGHERARLEVHARGSGIGFGLALFRVGSGVWGPAR